MFVTFSFIFLIHIKLDKFYKNQEQIKIRLQKIIFPVYFNRFCILHIAYVQLYSILKYLVIYFLGELL